MAALSSACALLPLEGRAGVVPLAQDGNSTCSNGGVECVMRATKGSGRRMASLRMKLRLSASSTTRSVHKQSLNVGAVLVTESWLGSGESVSNTEESIGEENVEFPSKFDLLRLERVRLSDMEHSFRVGYDSESALLKAEQGFVEQLELLLGCVSSLVREAEGTTSTTELEEDADTYFERKQYPRFGL